MGKERELSPAEVIWRSLQVQEYYGYLRQTELIISALYANGYEITRQADGKGMRSENETGRTSP